MTIPEPRHPDVAPPPPGSAPVDRVAPPPPAEDVAPQPPGWWKRNRWAVVALPVALIVALGGAADRLVDYWWSDDLRIEDARVQTGEPAWLTGAPEYRDVLDEDEPLVAETPTTRVGVIVAGVDELSMLDDGYDESPIPDGSDAYRVDLAFHADTPVDTTCSLELVDADGARYTGENDPLHQYSPCTKTDEDSGTVYGPEGEWRNSFTILTKEGVDLEYARVSYDGVHYVTAVLPDDL